MNHHGACEMNDLPQNDARFHSGRDLLTKYEIAIKCVYILNQLLFFAFQFAIATYTETSLIGCTILPTARTDFDYANNKALIDYNSTGLYDVSFDKKELADFFGRLAVAAVGFIASICICVVQCASIEGNIARAFWAIGHSHIIPPFFDEIRYRELTHQVGYVYGFIESCYNNNNTKSGCQASIVAKFMEEGIENNRILASSCVYKPNQPIVILYHITLAIMYLTLFAGIAVSFVRARVIRIEPERIVAPQIATVIAATEIQVVNVQPQAEVRPDESI